LGLSGPVPRRVDAATKAGLLRLIDRATAAGWEHRRACGYLELAEGRAWRWYERREAGRLEDHRSGAGAVHGLLASERAAIIALFDAWGEIDRSHRKLAHRGSYEGVVWVSPATVRRVLAANGLILRRPRRAGRSERRPFPEWATYTRNSIWIYDTTHFKRCPATAVITVMDLVTRKWICEIVSTEETSTQVQVAFTDALELEGLLDAVDARVAGYADRSLDDAVVPILLAVSDNGPQMTSGSTREFMAMCAIAQHFGRLTPRPTRPGSRASSATSRPTGHTSTRSPTRPSCAPSLSSCASSTTPSGCMPASATSPRMTSTKAAARRSAAPAASGSCAPADSASLTIVCSAINANRRRAADAV
jgi:hypothetical protein